MRTSARDLSIAFRRDRADDAASGNAAQHANHPAKKLMTREELFASLAKKGIPPFATSVLGFILGSFVDRGVTENELRSLCALLIDQIGKATKNPEIVGAVEKFTSLVETSVAR